MSYINVSFTHRANTPSLLDQRLDLGFSREGGRLDGAVQRAISSSDARSPLRLDVSPSPAVTHAANAVRDAVQAANWVQDVVLVDGSGRTPGTVTWTFRNGGGGTAATNALPAPVQGVVDALLALERVAAPIASILPL